MMFARQQTLSVTPPNRRRVPPHDTAAAPRCWQQTGSHAPDANEPLDLEALALAAGSEYEDTCRRSTRWRSNSTDVGCSAGAAFGGSGLPLVCSNCGVSFFSLQITDDELECYCSGECKWSVIMYREMDRRMHALRRHLRAAATTSASAANAGKSKSYALSSPPPSSRSSAATADTESCESYSRYMDDVIACR